MTTLVRLPNWVGDALLALPAIEGLAAAGDALILAGRALPLEIAAHLDPAARRLLLRRGPGAGLTNLEAARALRGMRIDRAVLLTPSFSAALAVRLAGIPERIGWAEQGRGPLLTRRVARPERGTRHICDEFKDVARAAGAAAFPEAPALPLDAQAARAARAWLREHDPNRPAGAPRRLALCPGVNYGWAKQWPAQRFCEVRRLAEERGWGGLVIGSAADRDLAREILAGAGPGWICAAGEGSLRFSAELLRSCAAAVCNDTGTMHLAAAVGTPVAAIFGPSEPGWTGPLGPRSRVLRAACSCSPCYRRTCEQSRPAPCMLGVTAREVVDALAELTVGSGAPGPAGGERAVFVDRDGTLCALVPYLRDPGAVALERGAAGAVRRLRAAGWKVVVVTNQSGVARGLMSRADVDAVHAALDRLLASAGAAVDGYHVCPHHPDFTGPCDCRKPAPGLLRQAAGELGIDLARSVMIGDTVEDVQAGAAAGCRTFLAETGYGAEQARTRAGELPPGTTVVADLGAAANLLLEARAPLAAG